MTNPHLRFGLLAAACVLGCALPGFAQTVVSDPSSLTWYKTRTSDSITPNTSTQSVLLTEGQTSASTFLTNFPIFILLVIALAVIFTWVFNHTQGSIFTAILVHAGINTPQIVWIPFFLAIDVTTMDLAALIGFAVPALLIVILTRGQLGYKPGQEASFIAPKIEAQPVH